MIDLYPTLKHVVFNIQPEIAHKLALKFIKYNCCIDKSVHDYQKPYLTQRLFNLNFDSPIGLAAGFDKNGEVCSAVDRLGFGFAEIGTVTPKPQAGNPKPRLFRIIENEALINRLGFNNDGVDQLIANVHTNQLKQTIPLGINIGPNKNTTNFIDDYILLIDKIYQNCQLFNYITINISSPNTAGLRDLQEENALNNLLSNIYSKIDSLNIESDKKLPVFLKIAPDLDDNALDHIIELALKYKIEALIISNTTIDKSTINIKYADYAGGLSGKPLFDKSTQLLAKIYKITEGKLKLIGVGGVSNAEDAYQKIKAGASLVQLYTGIIYHGPFLASVINQGLVKLLQKDKFTNISEAIGVEL